MQQAMQITRAKKAPWHWLRYRRVDAWVCGLDHLKAECLGRTPLDEARCHVLPLPLDDRWFASAEASSAFREALELPEGAWLLGTVGRLDPKKGQRTALQALAHLPEHVHWLFVGNNTVDNNRDERAALVERAQSLGVAERAHFLDARADVLPVYDALDAFVMTSDSESIGTVTLEALAREVPVIGTDSGGTSELLDVGRGQLVPPRNAEAMAEAVTVLMQEVPETLAVRTRNGRDYATKCRPTQLIPAWEELLASLVQSRRKA
jgi:glycosyltransferase involved in cell wall biosynthesis